MHNIKVGVYKCIVTLNRLSVSNAWIILKSILISKGTYFKVKDIYKLAHQLNFLWRDKRP
jgi:hypothetical protein